MSRDRGAVIARDAVAIAPAEPDEAQLSGLALAACGALERRLAYGEDPRTAATQVVTEVFGGDAGALPGGPEQRERIVTLILTIILSRS